MDIDSIYDLVQNTDFSLNIVAFLQENVGVLMSVSTLSKLHVFVYIGKNYYNIV